MAGVGAYDLKDENQAKAYLDELEKTWLFECFSEKSAEGCHRLAAFYDSVRQDFPRATKLYKTNCEDNNYGQSCYMYGQYAMTGKGDIPQDKKISYEYYTKGCNASPPWGPSCHNGALMRTTDEFKDFPKAVQMFEKACDLQDSVSCFRVSSIYYQGKEGVPQNFGKALDWSKKACELRDWRGCKNVAVMYAKGEGIHKDDNLANKYMGRAKIIFEEQKS